MTTRKAGKGWRWLALGGAGVALAWVGAARAENWDSAKKVDGRMTGGGHFACEDAYDPVRVTHGFELHCDADDPPNNLELNWDGNRFHLEELTWAFCLDDPNLDPRPRSAPLDTLIGAGTGRYNGVSGATIDFKLTDAGEPGQNDLIKVVVRDAVGDVVLECENTLGGGNHQAHPAQP